MRKLHGTIAAGALLAVMTTVATMTASAQMGQGRGPGQMGPGMGMAGQGMMGHHMMGPGSGMGAGMGMQDPAGALASAKTAIGIKPDQAAAWDTYAKVVTETAARQKQVRENIDRDAVRAMKPEEHQAFRDTMMKQHEEAATKVKAAAETLLAALDDAQKAKARNALPGLAQTGPGFGMGHGMMGHRMGQQTGAGMGGQNTGSHSAH